MIRVAIVEDFALLREDLWELIGEQKDMEAVWQAGSGQEAVEKAKNEDADIVLMDIEMETVNAGILAAEQIRDQGKGQQVIFLTAHETDQTIITAMGTGAVDYIVKGCQEQEILRHIRNAYKGKPVMEARIQETYRKILGDSAGKN